MNSGCLLWAGYKCEGSSWLQLRTLSLTFITPAIVSFDVLASWSAEGKT